MGFSSTQLATASLITQIGGAATSAIGARSSASAQRTALKSQAAVADINARIAELGAQSALQQGQRQVGALTHRAGQLKSSQRAAMAANGIDLSTGSAAEIQASTDIMKDIDVDTLTLNAMRTAWGYRTQAMNYQNEAMAKRSTARGINPGQAAFTSLLGSAGSVASSWYALSKSGATGGDKPAGWDSSFDNPADYG